MKTIALAALILSAFSSGSLYRAEHRERLTRDNAAAILRRMPGVKVSTTGPENAKQVIVHLADCHFVPLDQFTADLKDQGANAAEIATAYREHLQEVQAHQVHQLAILRALIRHHKLRFVLVEGVTRENSAFVDVRIMLAGEIQSQLPAIRARLAEVKPGTEIHGKIVALLAEHRRNMLELGAAGRLVVLGELSGVLPLDDAAAIENANPLKDGRFKMDAKANARREKAIVANAVKRGEVSVIVLGRGHRLEVDGSSDCPRRSPLIIPPVDAQIRIGRHW